VCVVFEVGCRDEGVEEAGFNLYVHVRTRVRHVQTADIPRRLHELVKEPMPPLRRGRFPPEWDREDHSGSVAPARPSLTSVRRARLWLWGLMLSGDGKG
jgi:hypothetical protein